MNPQAQCVSLSPRAPHLTLSRAVVGERAVWQAAPLKWMHRMGVAKAWVTA